MSTRLMLCIALGIQSCFTLTHAANDLEKWNSEVGRTVRQAQSDKLAQTTYREMSEPYRVCRRPLFLRECPDEKSKIHP